MQTHASEYFKGKKITLMGLGLLGRGLGDAKFLAEAGAELIVTDLKSGDELATSVGALAGLHDSEGRPAKITFHLGGHRLEDFENRDLIIKAQATPLDSPFIAHARELGIPVEMDAALFVKLAMKKNPQVSSAAAPTIVGVTGTRGKSTVTQLIYEMARMTSAKNIYLGGNVKDTATLPLIEKIGMGENAGAGDIVILELDSWQLQGFEEDKISPQIAVWTNFMPDHMNYYHGDIDRYFADKAAIARFQKPSDFFIAPREIKEKIEARFGSLAGNFIDPGMREGENAGVKTPLMSSWEIALPGEHNRANAAFAVVAARQLGIPDEVIKKVLKEFTGLPNRLERLGEKKGIVFYNDSNATTPEAAIAALQTLAAQGRPIVLIAGGSDKELEFVDLTRIIEAEVTGKSIKKIILFEGKASEKMRALLATKLPENFLTTMTSITMASNMQQAFDAALASAAPGDTILLSPGATSFGIFKNEYDRGEQFRKLFEYAG